MAVAQKNASAALIVDKVDDGQLMMLRGNTLPVANAQNDVGRVSSNLAMKDLILVLKRSPEQQAAFDAFVASQYDASSPNFHQWIEPAEIGERFGPSQADIATISSWLSGHGFSVDEVSKDRMTIRFGGTARQVESAFHTQIHNLTVKGEQHIANMSDPQIPMALEPVVAGVKALHNFNPRPLHHLGSTVTRNSDTGKWTRTASVTGTSMGLNANAIKVQPELGITVGTGTSAFLVEDVTPYDFAAIYNVLPLWNAATPIDGTGQTIAIAGTSKIVQADVTSFRSIFGLPAGTTPQQVVANGTDPGICSATTGTAANGFCTIDDQTENALDVEWSGAVAKGAKVVLVVSGANATTTDTVFASSNYVIQNHVANILNVSYGLCELFMGTGGNTSYNNLWQTAQAAGIAVFVASGDSGSPSCDQGQATSTPYGAQYGLSVSGLASTPYNTAVGGTDFNWGSTAAPYWGTSNSTTNGSNALGYMPEAPWNDTCTNPLALSYFQGWAKSLKNAGFNATSPTDGESACNFIVTWNSTIMAATNPPVDLSGFVNSVGAGGGASNCTVNNTTSTTTTADPTSCSGGYAKPAWQAVVTGIPADGKRDIPDVSFFASNGFLGSAYLICVSANGACVTSTSPTTEPTAQEIGGTSAASPAMAGVMALINQKAGSSQGNPNVELYALGAKQGYSGCKTEGGTTSNGCYFNDVDTGTIAMACVAGKPNCTVSHSGDTVGVMSGYDAGVGFDLATGLGTLNVANVVNGWTSGTAKATVTLSPPVSIASNLPLTVPVTVSGSSGTPTGTVTLAAGSYTSAAQALSSGASTFSIPANTLTAGTVTVAVSYSGDSTYAANVGSATVTVTGPATFTVAAGTAAPIAAGGSTSSTITVTGSGGYAGTVTLACALTSSPTGATKLPTCSMGSGSVTLSSSATSATATATVSTTAAIATLVKPKVGGWAVAGEGAVLALLVFMGIPARRRSWRAMLGVLALALALGSLAACGGGGGGSSGGGGTPGTTAGLYTFTVTGTGSPAVTPAPTKTFTVTVN